MGLAISLFYPSGEEGGIFSCSIDLYLLSLRLEEEGEGKERKGENGK
jgi:hypothetical protein